MNITILDASNYFKGLLLLIRKDGRVESAEAELMKHVGKVLGFEPRFCENAISEILENKHIVDEPPAFSSKQLAAMFIKDGLMVALSDGELHPGEKQWLAATATRNGMDAAVIEQEVKNPGTFGRLEIEDVHVISRGT